MTGLLNKLAMFIASLGLDQYAALLVMIVVGIAALKVAKKAVSIILEVVGVLAALYFVQPELYHKAIEMLAGLWRRFVAAI